MPKRAPLPRIIRVSACLLVIAVCAAARAGTHPTLLISPNDVLRIRHACGVGEPGDPSFGAFGASADNWLVLRKHFNGRFGDAVLPGEIAAAAFVHLIDPADAADAKRLALIESSLTQSDLLNTDPFERALALDWCWADLKSETRREFLTSMHAGSLALAPGDSPLAPRIFGQKLTALAICAAVDSIDEPGPAWRDARERVLEAANAYFQSAFPRFVEIRGLIPTGPEAAATEESLAALAVELSSLVRGENAWPAQRAGVSRWLEHYWLLTNSHPSLQHQFLRDDCGVAPLNPVPQWTGMFPITAHLIAARSGELSARAVATGVQQRLEQNGEESTDMRAPWSWAPIVFGNFRAAPPLPRFVARNLDGAVIFRGGLEPNPCMVWIDTGQPFLRRRQHYDAGNFLIHAGGHLCVNAGEDVQYEAVPGKGGSQNLGGGKDPFEFEQFSVATVAHNCLVLWDAARNETWYGKPFIPVGGQRLIENTCTDFSAALEHSPRQTGRLLAYGHRDDPGSAAAYACVDLGPAYDPKSVSRYAREFIFFADTVLVVIDRVQTPRNRSVPTWILNVPARPTVDGKPLADGARILGATNDAGIWRCDQAGWLRWSERDGSLFLKSIAPEKRALRVTGGPAIARITTQDEITRTYVGGDPDGFERLVLPGERVRALNAWFRLGTPTLLGNMVGRVPLWGRVEIEPSQGAKDYFFVTVLVAGAESDERPPLSITPAVQNGALALEVTLDRKKITLQIPQSSLGGTLTLGESEWPLPKAVEADPPLVPKPKPVIGTPG